MISKYLYMCVLQVTVLIVFIFSNTNCEKNRNYDRIPLFNIYCSANNIIFSDYIFLLSTNICFMHRKFTTLLSSSIV